MFAIEDVTPIHISRLKLAWDNVVESHGNVFLNLSDTPLPSTYPKPPAGFTILQGQAARDYWEKSKAAWIANHDGVGDAALTALPPLPGTSPVAPAPTPTPTPAPTADADAGSGRPAESTINGTSGCGHADRHVRERRDLRFVWRRQAVRQGRQRHADRW